MMIQGSLLDSKSVSTLEITRFGETWFKPLWSNRDSSRVTIHSCSSRGKALRASYSTSRTSRPKFDSVGKRELFLGIENSRVVGSNEVLSSSSLFIEKYGILDAHEDEYEGIIISSEQLPLEAAAFAYRLRASLSHWKLKGKKGVWLKLPLEQSDLVPIAVKEGFIYHHAEAGFVMLTFWIPEGPCMLPDNASHHVGVGSFVINDKNEVLVVQEKHCPSSYASFWKLPTGFIVESEEIFSGAVREVKEETGIDTEFVEVVSFRHALNMAFGKSDLFFICMLRPLSTRIMIDNLEIQAAKWMPLAEFVNQTSIQGDPMFRKIIDICIARLGNHYCRLSNGYVISKFDSKISSLYYNVADTQDYNCLGA